MKYISKQDEEDLQPYYINMKLAYQKGLSDGINVNDKYFELYSIYYNYLEKYLNDIINIADYEKKLDSMGFRGVIDDDKDIYQYLSYNKYFYIRNTLYIEKIPESDIVYLLKNSNNYDNNIKQIISKTFKDVISASIGNTHIFYGPFVPTYSALNDSLVIGLRFAEEDETLYESEDKWFDDFSKRRLIIEDLINNLPAKINDVNIKYIEYFEESVKKKSTNQVIMK